MHPNPLVSALCPGNVLPPKKKENKKHTNKNQNKTMHRKQLVLEAGSCISHSVSHIIPLNTHHHLQMITAMSLA